MFRLPAAAWLCAICGAAQEARIAFRYDHDEVLCYFGKMRDAETADVRKGQLKDSVAEYGGLPGWVS